MGGYMNVVLKLSSRQHAEYLARRLVQLTDRIRITDCAYVDEKVCDNNEPCFVVDDRLAADCSSASALLNLLRARYTEETGRRLCCAADDGPVIIGAGSAAGGSGTTAAAVTLARILAGRMDGETVLIFADRNSDGMRYLEDTGGNNGTFPSRQLDYMLTHNIETDITKYICRDRYGPLAAVSAADPRLLLDRLEVLYPVEAAVLDLGSRGRAADCHIYIETAACGDLRAADFEAGAAAPDAAGNKIFFLNKTAASGRRGRLFCLPDDPESFRLCTLTGRGSADSGSGIGNIEIAMDGMFAAAVRKAADEVMALAEHMRNR